MPSGREYAPEKRQILGAGFALVRTSQFLMECTRRLAALSSAWRWSWCKIQYRGRVRLHSRSFERTQSKIVNKYADTGKYSTHVDPLLSLVPWFVSPFTWRIT
eukprot:1865688-Prymnesium_polylepis.1